MSRQRMSSVLASLLMGVSLLANADEAADMVGSLGDEAYAWYVFGQDGDSHASFMEVGDQRHVHITGVIDPQAWRTQEALAVSLVLEKGELVDAKVVQFMGDSAMPPLYTSEGGEVGVTLNTVEQQGLNLKLQGTIQGVLALQHDLETPPQASEGVGIDVRFTVTARRVQF